MYRQCVARSGFVKLRASTQSHNCSRYLSSAWRCHNLIKPTSIPCPLATKVYRDISGNFINSNQLWIQHGIRCLSAAPSPGTSPGATTPPPLPPLPNTEGATPPKEDPSSKIEKTVKALQKETTPAAASTSVATPISTDVSKPEVRPLWKRIWDELVHYYHGFRLLFIDIRVCSRFLYRILHGESLTRREHKQLVRTTSDLFRLLPFSVFIIVPFMELLLPVALKLFPGLLPSTFVSASDEKAKLKVQLKVKLDMAKFLQTTLDEMAVKKRGETHSHAAKEFALFCEKIRESGSFASSEEILKFSKLFEDELTLDSLDRKQLVALCRLLEIPTLGTTQLLRFQLRMKLKNLKNDDEMIKREGLESLTVSELQAACRARGMRSVGVTEEKLRYQLSQWLDLSLRESIPPSLLLLSRAMLLPENMNPAEQLKETLTQLPKKAVTEAKYKIGELEGKPDNRTKLEIIKQEEEAIREERRERKKQQMEEQQALEEMILKEKEQSLDKEALLDMAPIVTTDGIIKDKPKEAQELTKKDLDELEDALETIAAEKKKLLIEREEIEDIKEELKDYEEDVKELVQFNKGSGVDVKESKGAMRLYKQVNAMIQSLDGVIDKLNEEREEKQKIIDTQQEKKELVRDDIIGINELVLSMRRLQKSTDDTRIQMIQEILDSMDSDHDGKIEVDVVLKVIDVLGRENVKVAPGHMKEIIELMLREEALKKAKAKKDKETEGVAQETTSSSGSESTTQDVPKQP